MGSKIVAKRGDSTYLIDVGEGQGIVADLQYQERLSPFGIQKIFARGYWVEIRDNKRLRKRLMSLRVIDVNA